MDSKDLLKGEIVRSMAASIASTWNRLRPQIEQGSELIKERDLLENQESFNAIIVFLAWYQLVFERFETISSSVPVRERDSIEKKLKQSAIQFLDRWVFGSQWANIWGDGAVQNFQNFATDLNSINVKLKKCQASNLAATVDDGIDQLMRRISAKATEQINNVVVTDRKRVHLYYPLLWVWHRLEEARWAHSSVPMRTGRKRKSKLEVDHTVADAWWARLINKEIAAKLILFIGTEEEKNKVAPDDFLSRMDAFAFVNLLGNCSLLEKSFNISKSDESMWKFLEEVREFKDGKIKRNDWESALSLTETLTSPDTSTLTDIKKAIQTRDSVIRKDLTDFIAGSKHRVD
ncbi:MAG: hypothetical protein AABY86_04060 [Bdellovibrionota bacterium]